MIDNFRDVILICVNILKMEITAPQIGTVSLWGALLFGLIVSAIWYAIIHTLNDD